MPSELQQDCSGSQGGESPGGPDKNPDDELTASAGGIRRQKKRLSRAQRRRAKAAERLTNDQAQHTRDDLSLREPLIDSTLEQVAVNHAEFITQMSQLSLEQLVSVQIAIDSTLASEPGPDVQRIYAVRGAIISALIGNRT